MARSKWYKYDADEAIAELGSSVEIGLTDKQIVAARKVHGKNKLEAKGKVNPLSLFLSQFKDTLVIVLIISAVISYAVSFLAQRPPVSIEGLTNSIYTRLECGRVSTEARRSDAYCETPLDICASEFAEMASEQCAAYNEVAEKDNGAKEALLILIIVLAIAIIGFLNEYKAEKTVQALRKLVGEDCVVRRNGQKLVIESSDLVPGDIVLLSEGAKIPADIRLITTKNFLVSEASLTGESIAVEKHAYTLTDELALGDQRNMAFSGTFVSQGTAEGVVVTTGQDTELGKIASLVNSVEAELTPMQTKLNELGKKLGLSILAICIVVFLLVLLLTEEVRNLDTMSGLVFALTAAVALAVAAIPEGLAFVVRISLALGARRMAAKNALVRRLSAVEALGSTDVICSDKTGTLTKGEMTVRECATIGGAYTATGLGYNTLGRILNGTSSAKSPALDKLMLIGALCNDAGLHGKDKIIGDPTEAALLVSSDKYHISYLKVQKLFTRTDEIPFNSSRKKMTTVHVNGNLFFVASKGATEKILSSCDRYINDDGMVLKLDAAIKSQIKKQTDDMSGRALRVIAFAYSEARSLPKSEELIEKNLIFAGLQGIMDPPRKEVVRVIGRVQTESGMRVMMITGDHIETAKAIAREIGIIGDALSGTDIDELSEAKLKKAVETVSVFARVDPEHKIRIIRALQANGHQVAMTGDGVNDAPAIRAADIGIAMGITGTDASKEAADLILLDDQFLTIIAAVEEGRGIYVNLRKFLNLLLSANLGKVMTVLLGILLFNNLLLSAAQLLFINLISDGLPAVALAADPSPKDVLKNKPAAYRSAILTRHMMAEIVIFGSSMAAMLIAHFWLVNSSQGFTAATSVVFLGAIVYGLARLVSIKLEDSLHNPFDNPKLLLASASSIALALCVLYIEPLAESFGVQPVRLIDWAILLAGSVVLIIMMRLLRPFFIHLGR